MLTKCTVARLCWRTLWPDFWDLWGEDRVVTSEDQAERKRSKPKGKAKEVKIKMCVLRSEPVGSGLAAVGSQYLRYSNVCYSVSKS